MCFVCSIILIGFFTAIIGDLANYFGCSVGLKDAVTAISFVAMGTSVPGTVYNVKSFIYVTGLLNICFAFKDMFASKVAAVQDAYADSSIGNVTGSNAVNVFLGIGLAWLMCALVAAGKSGDEAQFRVDPGTLAFSVTLFCTAALITIALLLLRRKQFSGGGELGGRMLPKVATVAILVSLWLAYIILSSLESYCIIKGF